MQHDSSGASASPTGLSGFAPSPAVSAADAASIPGALWYRLHPGARAVIGGLGIGLLISLSFAPFLRLLKWWNCVWGLCI